MKQSISPMKEQQSQQQQQQQQMQQSLMTMSKKKEEEEEGDEDDEDDNLFENMNNMNYKRTKLHNIQTVQWLKRRYQNKTKKHYLLYPEEQIEDMKIRKIFKIFDKDKSKALDLEEMVEMFQKYNIEIDKDELQQIYDIVDKTKDNALNYIEFKECAISQTANSIFSKMITKVRQQEQQSKSPDQRNIYLPQRFAEMVTYLSYRINRDDLELFLKQRNHRISERYEKYLQLINLNGLDSAGATAHENQIKDQKKLDKASDLEQKIFDRQSSSDSNNESLEVEKSFRNQIKEEQLKKQQKAQLRLSLATNSVRKASIQVTSSPSPRHQSPQLDSHYNATSNYYLQSSLAGPQMNAAISPKNNNNTNSLNSNSQIGISRGSIRNSRLRTSTKKDKEIDEEQIIAKFTKYEAQSLSKKAQLKGSSEAQQLYTEVSKQYGSQDNLARTFMTNQNSSYYNNGEQQSKFNLKTNNNGQNNQTDNLMKSNMSNNHFRTQPATANHNQKGIRKFFGGNNDFDSTYNSQTPNNTIYGTRQKFSNDDFRNTEVKGFQNITNNNINNNTKLSQVRSVSQFSEAKKSKFNSTFYTLGKRPKTNQTQLQTLGIDKSSFKSISNVMNRTLQQLENRKISKNLFLNTAPSSTRFNNNNGSKFQENRVHQMSQKLINQNIESNIIDPKLMQSVYKPNQIQEYQEREKQLINEIKQDIMDKFLMNNKVAVSLYEEMQQNQNQQNPYYRISLTQNTEQSFFKQNKPQELELMSKFADKEKTPVIKSYYDGYTPSAQKQQQQQMQQQQSRVKNFNSVNHFQKY